jgi:small nuclear ribonucleoprotein (snRNP)-like protein
MLKSRQKDITYRGTIWCSSQTLHRIQQLINSEPLFKKNRMASRGEKDAVLDFAKYCDQRVRVRFQGGREVDGVLKGYDKLDNLVLEEAVEYLRGELSRICEVTFFSVYI